MCPLRVVSSAITATLPWPPMPAGMWQRLHHEAAKLSERRSGGLSFKSRSTEGSDEHVDRLPSTPLARSSKGVDEFAQQAPGSPHGNASRTKELSFSTQHPPQSARRVADAAGRAVRVSGISLAAPIRSFMPAV